MRRDLQPRRSLRRIVDFGHNQVFEGVSAYTCLVFLGAGPTETFQYERLDKKVNAASLAAAEFTTIHHDQLKHDKWRLVKDEHAANIQRLESIGRPLGEVAAIKVGFATLKDSVFLTRDRGDHCGAVDPAGRSHTVERELTRPAVKIAELGSISDLGDNDRRVIFPYERCGNRYRLMPQEKLESLYPNSYHYLCECREALNARDAGRKEYEGWYAWGRTQGMDAMGPKLLTKTFSKSPQFMLDHSDQLFCNGYAVFARPAVSLFDNAPIGVLARLLNSRVMHYYTKMTSFQIGGDYQCYQKNFIERFSIVDMTEQEQKLLVGLPPEDVDAYVARLYGLELDVLNQALCPS